jgi:TonB-linked SusC/RagA family outer membrane protein
LVFKSQFGYKLQAYSVRSFIRAYDLATSVSRTENEVEQRSGLGYGYTWDNTLNYIFAAGNHHVDILAGQSVEKWGMGESIRATNQKTLFDDFEHAYLVNTGTVAAGQTTVTGNPATQGSLVSVFGRINYNYNETYLATLVFRADGSSNFASGKRWGYFPSVSAGWVVTNESFMAATSSWMDFLKIRASWGQNGNCNISPFQYLATVAFDDARYAFGTNKTITTIGGYADKLANPDVTWETSEQINIGLDARFFHSRLGLTFDWYTKNTKDWLVQAPVLGAYGMGASGAPYVNGGDITNKGVEFALNWNDRISDFTYGIDANVSYNKNEVTRIANSEGIIHGNPNVLSQGTTEMYRAQVGYPIGYFYGYQTAGIFQTLADIEAWKATGDGILQGNVQPGDIKFVDRNHDGKIDEDDKTQIGNPWPTFRMGLNLHVGYKGADLSMAMYGAFGQQIAKAYREFASSPAENYTTEVFQRWHGAGTSNKWPRLTAGSNPNYMNISDIYIEDGDFLRCQNITVGYDFKYLFPKLPFGQLRFYFTAQNLFTITGYSGMDPEVGYSPTVTAVTAADNWTSGVDIGFYPVPRTYLIGINLKF